MIRLIDLLKEFEYGKQLFSDPKNKSIVDKETFKDTFKNFNIDFEPNTEDETQFLKSLRLYFGDDINKKIDVGVLKYLLQLKSKFPNILDPQKSRYSSAYRGSTMGIDNILKAKIKRYNYNTYIIESPNIEIQSRGATGYLSFSNSYQQAVLFSKVNSKDVSKLISNNRFPIIAEIDLSSPELLFNTEFTKLFSEFDEEEFMLIDTKYKPINIFIQDPNVVFDKIKNIKKQAPKFYELQKHLDSL
jgi:hypothetical protein